MTATVTDEHRQQAREVAHSLQSRCSGGTGYGAGGDGPRYHSASCDTATTVIAQALADAEAPLREKNAALLAALSLARSMLIEQMGEGAYKLGIIQDARLQRIEDAHLS